MYDPIIMMDWTRHNEVSARSPEEFVWHQVICALIHDEVAAPDEILVMSKRLPDWFKDKEKLQIFYEVLDFVGLTALKRPLEAYPEELRDYASRKPINGRRDHLIAGSVDNNGDRIKLKSFSDKDLRFHDSLDAYFMEHSNSHRFASRGTPGSDHLFDRFRKLLLDVLKLPEWEDELDLIFRGEVSEADKMGFIRLVEDPELAVAHINAAEEGKGDCLRTEPLRFTTAIAQAVAKTFGKPTSTRLSDLIETVFQRPYCDREGAAARMGKYLHPLPDIGTLRDSIRPSGPSGGVFPDILLDEQITLSLPMPRRGIADVMHLVLSRPNRADLKLALREFDNSHQARDDSAIETARKRLIKAWEGVGQDFAAANSKVGLESKQIKARSVVLAGIEGAAPGFVVDLCTSSPGLFTTVGAVVGAAGEGLLKLSFSREWTRYRLWAEGRRIYSGLKSAVDWSGWQRKPATLIAAKPEHEAE